MAAFVVAMAIAGALPGVPLRCLSAEDEPANTLFTEEVRHEKALGAMRQEQRSRLKVLRDSYTGALEKLEASAMERGDLDLVLAAKQEKGSVGMEPLSEEERAALAPEVSVLRGKFEKAVKRITDDGRSREIGLLEEHSRQLLELQEGLTQRSEIEAAVNVRDARGLVLARLESLRDEALHAAPGSAKSEAPKPPSNPVPEPVGGDFGLDLRPGLAVYEFVPLDEQKDDASIGIPYSEFGSPVGEVREAGDFQLWSWNPDRNSVAVGYLRIDEPGSYGFEAYAFYDRIALHVGDIRKPLCRYRDRGDGHQEVRLKKGMVPIIAVGYIQARGRAMSIHWKPPGSQEYKPIPGELLFHDRAAADKLFQKKR